MLISSPILPKRRLYSRRPGKHANKSSSGKVLKIEAAGNFTEEIVQGAYVLLSVKYNRLITLFSSKEDLCDQMKNVDKECPLEKGKLNITKEVELPTRIPPVSSATNVVLI